eukprot:TRINITY_DN2867_c1_g1_i1.p1 TRINITY_DN2867_c1_g1~~TRINITY_DN2867_c1_g1_i1.p1  ORF type:complete len:387 (+),score=76.34 TRINITY_DN2867_c1_g1_i1:64-1224(+)
MKGLIVGLVVVVCLLGWISMSSGHSEQFHRFPLHPRHFPQNHPSQYDAIVEKLRQKQSNPSNLQAESKHLRNTKAITHQGTNAEAYWSFDGKWFSFQGIFGPEGEAHPCDQIYIMTVNGTNVTRISDGEGRDTCSYFFPNGYEVLYSSTKAGGPWCPATPDMSYGYLWPIYDDMSMYKINLHTRQRVRLTSGRYNAETTISPDGTKIIFTSSRSGDLELYSMKLDGTNVRRLTYTPGYDGGAYYSFNSKMITWRASRPQGQALTDYLNLLNLGLVEPLSLQIYAANDDGSNPIQVTNFTNTVAFSPFFLPDDSGVIFSSNYGSATGMEFQLFIIKLDGTGLQQITYEGTFNSFPMFSPNGKQLAWESNRNTKSYSDLNVLVADWVN